MPLPFHEVNLKAIIFIVTFIPGTLKVGQYGVTWSSAKFAFPRNVFASLDCVPIDVSSYSAVALPMLPFITAIAQKGFLKGVNEFFACDTQMWHFPFYEIISDSVCWRFTRTITANLFFFGGGGAFYRWTLTREGSNSWSSNWLMLMLFTSFVKINWFILLKKKNKEKKITPTLRGTLISSHCQDSHKYKQ